MIISAMQNIHIGDGTEFYFQEIERWWGKTIPLHNFLTFPADF